VNVPADHIKDPAFADFVERALSESGLDPAMLGIEIVESTLLDQPGKCTQALMRLRDLGVRIAIDDFGTGYSNLSYLRDFPVTTLKIDRDFVKNVPGNARDNGLARAIIAMGDQLGMNIVAEGIETQEQFDFLKEAGCTYGQGYLMSKPLELAAYLARLAPVSGVTPPTSGRRPGSSSDWPDVGIS
jgi:EAL domain-containing protein (putative c-di-GMP-specific phosphodiesterase class I)